MTTLTTLSNFIWGPYLLIPLLLFTGVFLTVRLRGLQFRELGPALYLSFVRRKEHGASGDISHFQALMTALAATVGTGNIVGVATAIAIGGPGALFWMWVTGLFGMATKYCEALLSVKYRITDHRGEQAGGPMYYLSRGIPQRQLGRLLGAAFALFTGIAAFGIGNMVQANAVADALDSAFGIPDWQSGMALSIGLALVVLGGIRSIGRVTSVIVPAMIALYLTSAGAVWVVHFDQIGAAFALVFTDAFTGTAATGGFLGSTAAMAIRYGVARGIFSNESGLGSAGIAAAAAQTAEPARQALVSMTQTFIDTLVVCTFTGIAIIATGAWNSAENGVLMTQLAFNSVLPQIGGIVIATSLAMFAFSTILGWCYYGERSIEYLLGERAIVPYRIAFVVVAYVGAIRTLDFVWLFSDVMNGLMALPNLIGLLLLSGVVVTETRSYHERNE
ncbi:MAG: sodium:alanine symporter family protein [Gammaproteobacteria bacterium]|nr:sodium:alanine symporter family protein [Gammaproteobacteria bacterium]